jgi:AraC-like DNA-binding protein
VLSLFARGLPSIDPNINSPESTMLLLALTCERVRVFEEGLADMLGRGELASTLLLGQERLARSSAGRDPRQECALGQLLGRALLAAGRAEDAEELFQRMHKSYEAISRQSVRWFSSLDQAELSLHLNRPGRACEGFNLVADDEAAPPELRIEAMAGLAVSLQSLGEHQRAVRTLQEAARRAREAQLPVVEQLVAALELELVARFRIETCEGLCDYALGVIEDAKDARGDAELCADLAAAAQSLQAHRLAVRSLDAVRVLLSHDAPRAAGLAQLADNLAWRRGNGFARDEAALRLDAALAMLARDDARAAIDLLGVLVHDEQAARRHPHALQLRYCRSRLAALDGRQVEALQAYKEYAKEALYRTTRERTHLPYSRFLERHVAPEQADAAMFRLPLRYRRAYKFIIEHLDDRKLSIRQIAAHIDVTERALQMAFRTHLGMTPAELIRHRRMEHIRSDLVAGAGRSSVLQTAARWGMTNRSTLAHSYRQQFAETPTATLRGGA